MVALLSRHLFAVHVERSSFCHIICLSDVIKSNSNQINAKETYENKASSRNCSSVGKPRQFGQYSEADRPKSVHSIN
jgi:hypothetical protein